MLLILHKGIIVAVICIIVECIRRVYHIYRQLRHMGWKRANIDWLCMAITVLIVFICVCINAI